MKRNGERSQRLVGWLGVVCLGLMPVGALSAQEPKLRDTLKGHTQGVLSVAFSPDGKTLASGSLDQTIKLWDVATGKEQVTLKGHTDGARSVAFSPDGKTLASGSIDMTIALGHTSRQEGRQVREHNMQRRPARAEAWMVP